MIKVNALEGREGTWTRIEKETRSVINFILLEGKEIVIVKRTIIDEHKSLTPYHVKKGEKFTLTIVL